tara:strand:- start:1853 stop:2701 length:849 start_codon:yes stop_codon:yes gene_type:complete
MRVKKVQTQWVYWVPKKLISRWVGWFARCRCRRLSGYLIRWYASYFKVSLQDAESSDLSTYATLNEFFTRALKPGARPIDPNPNAFCSPCDATLGQLGRLSGATLVQAKGHYYTLDDLIGQLGEGSAPFINGAFATLYLSPKDYHRVHVPMDCTMTHMQHIPGALFPVFPKAVATIPKLYARNERVVFWLETEQGPIVMVMIGALNVGSIHVKGYGTVNSTVGVASEWQPSEPYQLKKGEELAWFNMGGSCVVVCVPEQQGAWHGAYQIGQKVLVGQNLRDD